MNRDFLVCFIEGGLGKVVAATAAIRCLKKANPDKKIVTVSGYPEVFDRNPNVHRTFGFNENKYLYGDYVKNGTILERDPYHLDSYRFDEVPLAQAYCESWGIAFDGNKKPELFLDDALMAITAKEIKDLKASNLPVAVVQYMGRSPMDQQSKTFIPTGRENADLFQKALTKLCGKMKFIIMKLPEEPKLAIPKNTVVLQNPVHFARWFGYIYNSDGVITVDSCSHHIAAAFKKPGVVCWGRTSSKSLGYEEQTNILGECEERPCGGFMKVPAHGWGCNHNFKCIKSITVDMLVDSIEQTFLK